MFAFGSGTLYKMIVNSDGSPNWVGIVILGATSLAIFMWRCVVIALENEALVRLRFGGVVTDAKTKVMIDGFNQFAGAKEYGKGLRFRLYSVHSLVKVNCADRRTGLEPKTVTFFDRDHEISPTALWRVSRDTGCPSKSLFNVQDSDPKDKKNAELEALVRELVDDAVVRAYASLNEGVKPVALSLPVLTLEDHLQDVVKLLYNRYGVELLQLLYGRNAVASAQRGKEGNLAIAEANTKIAAAQNNVADAIRGVEVSVTQTFPAEADRASA